MEASSCAIRQLPRCSASLVRVGRGDMGLRRAVPPRICVGGRGFSDEGHLRFYAKCGGKAEKEEKRRAKLAKGLSKDLSALMEGLATSCADGVIQEASFGNKMTINEAASVLLAHLEETRASAKAMKKQEKEMKKAQKKASKMDKTKGCCEDSSSSSSESSSESSDSDCEEQRQVVDMSRLRMTGSSLTVEDVPASLSSVCLPTLPGKKNMALLIPEQKSGSVTDCCSDVRNSLLPDTVTAVANGAMVIELPARHVSGTSAAEGAIAGASSVAGIAASPQGSETAAVASPVGHRIEVCMGGKCKKSGSVQLMEELQRQVGAEAAVVGCKCMGKCKEGPNVRVCHQEDGAPPMKGPLCVGVGLEDVGTLVSSYFGDRNLGLMAAAP